MDLVVLQRLTRELNDRLAGVRIDRVYAIPKQHLALVLGVRGAPRLWFCSEPDLPHLYERPGRHPSPRQPPTFAMAARKLLSGRRIASLECAGGDRVIELRCKGEDAARFVFELIPRRATAMVVDAAGVVRAVWHQRRGRPSVGDRYSPPDRSPRSPAGSLSTDDWEHITAGPDPEAVARNLLRRVSGMSLLVAREAAARHAAGTPLPEAVGAELERSKAEPTSARIYAPVPLEELEELPRPADFILAPYPLKQAEETRGHTLNPTIFDGLREAAAVFFPLRAELAALQLARRELDVATAAESARLRRVLEAVSADRESFAAPATYRRWADLLLAHPDATREAGVARLPDDYAGGEPVEIAIHPARSLPDNAQAYYAKARRAERSAEKTRRRQAYLERRIDRISGLKTSADRLRDLASARGLARAASKEGLALRAERWAAPEAVVQADDTGATAWEEAEDPRDRSGDRATGAGRWVQAGILAFIASDGSEILVGRNASSNERLTHRLAAPHDFWLHAEGPGSHVVIRNPDRSEFPGEDALREAAALAAYFSSARGATKVNVRWTKARHVRKARGGPRGQVILRQADTFLAEPVAPEELFGAPHSSSEDSPSSDVSSGSS